MDPKKTIVIIKAAVFLGLFAIFYVFYFREVVEKFAARYTNFEVTQETNEENTPFFTLCMSPPAKLSILKKYDMSVTTLNEPNPSEIKILASLNKTIEDLFLEATFKLDVDFTLSVSMVLYGDDGYTTLAARLHFGNDNFIPVRDIYIVFFMSI